MSDIIDYYAILEVHPNASRDVIDAAYRRLAIKYHPDVNAGEDALVRMKQLNQAYAVLSDSTKRAAYDRSRRPIAPPMPQSWNWQTIRLTLGLILFILILARFKVLGLVLGALILLIWLLARTRR